MDERIDERELLKFFTEELEAGIQLDPYRCFGSGTDACGRDHRWGGYNDISRKGE